MRAPFPDLNNALATIDAIAKHLRLDTTVRKGERWYRLALWTRNGRRVTGHGRTALESIHSAMVKLSQPQPSRQQRLRRSEQGVAPVLRFVREATP